MRWRAHSRGARVEAGFDQQVDPALRIFFYLPFEHSEDLADQERAVRAVTPLDARRRRRYGRRKHLDVIAPLRPLPASQPRAGTREHAG